MKIEFKAFLYTVLVGYLIGNPLGYYIAWPNASAVLAIAVMGAFILRYIRKTEEKTEEKDK